MRLHSRPSSGQDKTSACVSAKNRVVHRLFPLISPSMKASLQATKFQGYAAMVLITISLVAVSIILWQKDFFGGIYRFFILFKLPHPPEEGWLLGSAPTMLRKDHHRALAAWSRQLGPVYAIRILFWHLVVVVDAELANVILGNQEGLSKALEPDLSDTLLSHRPGHRTMFSSDTNSAYWRLIRKGTAPAFITANIKKGFPDVIGILSRVIANMVAMPPGAEVDMNNVTLRISLDVTGLVGFAKDFETCASFSDSGTDELFTIIQKTFRDLYCRTTNPARPYMLWLSEVREARRLFRAFKSRMAQLVQEVKARGEPAEDDVSIAAHLSRLRDPETGAPLPDDLLAGEFGLFFSAGIESAGNAISWTLYLISQHPEVEAKLVAELDKAGLLVTPQRPKPRTMEYADLNALTYLSWVCKEAMRVRPVAATGSTRYIKRDMVIGGHFLPKGSMVDVPFYAVHHHPDNWEDPAVFNPERWAVPHAELASAKGCKPDPSGETEAAESAEALGAAKRYLPFSAGPRQCIGQSLARILHDASVAQLLAHFTFQLAPRMGGPEGVIAQEINRLTLQPGAGMWMTFQNRALAHRVNGEVGPEHGLTKESTDVAEALANGLHI